VSRSQPFQIFKTTLPTRMSKINVTIFSVRNSNGLENKIAYPFVSQTMTQLKILHLCLERLACALRLPRLSKSSH